VDGVGLTYPVGKDVSPLVPAPAAANAAGQVGLLLQAIAVALDLALPAFEEQIFVNKERIASLPSVIYSLVLRGQCSYAMKRDSC